MPRREDWVGDGGSDAGGARLTDAARLFVTLDDVNLDGRCLVDAQHLATVEIALLHPSKRFAIR